MTTLSIIETQLGDVLAYISMNVISIIDGQKFLSLSLLLMWVFPSLEYDPWLKLKP